MVPGLGLRPVANGDVHILQARGRRDDLFGRHGHILVWCVDLLFGLLRIGPEPLVSGTVFQDHPHLRGHLRHQDLHEALHPSAW